IVAVVSLTGQSIATPYTRGNSRVGLKPSETAEDERKATRRSRMACAGSRDASCASATLGTSPSIKAMTSTRPMMCINRPPETTIPLARGVDSGGVLGVHDAALHVVASRGDATE